MKKYFKLIALAYRWLWHDILCRTEPFTYTFRRQYAHHKTIWTIITIIAVTALAYTNLPIIAGLYTWLIIHILDNYQKRK